MCPTALRSKMDVVPAVPAFLNDQRGGGRLEQLSAAYRQPDYTKRMWTLMVIVFALSR